MLPMSDGLVAVIQADGSGLTLRERSLQTKLDLLFSKHLYTVALNLARTEQVSRTPAAPVLPSVCPSSLCRPGMGHSAGCHATARLGASLFRAVPAPPC